MAIVPKPTGKSDKILKYLLEGISENCQGNQDLREQESIEMGNGGGEPDLLWVAFAPAHFAVSCLYNELQSEELGRELWLRDKKTTRTLVLRNREKKLQFGTAW